MEEHTCYMTVCGEGLTDIVRQMYCYEDKPLQALDILENLDGITIAQAKKVCTGLARLEDKPDGLIYYIEEKDTEFAIRYEKHIHWLTTVYLPRKKKEDQDLQKAMGETRDYWDKISTDAIMRTARVLRPGETAIAQALADKNRVLMEGLKLKNKEAERERMLTPSKETVKVGRFDVPKNLIDRYANFTVKRIRDTIRMGIAYLKPDNMEGFDKLLDLETERQDLHDAICKALGFDHDADKKSKEQVEFDNALYEYLDKHAGKLFDGDE